MEDFMGYPVYKGMQRPIEFLGIRGRFLIIAAATAVASFLGFVVVQILLGKIAGFITLFVSLAAGYVTIWVKQKNGLHNKRRSRDFYVYTHLYEH